MSRGPLLAGLLLIVALAGGYAAFAGLRSLPAATVTAIPVSAHSTGRPPNLGWPAGGQAAAAVVGAGVVGAHGSSRPAPIASLAKVMTAYLVLRDHPLPPRAAGPSIRVRRADVGVYRADRAAGQSVVLVQAGERLTERQALQGLLLPSGNNLATLLARWDAGSQRAFVGRMNAAARALGLSHTSYADASGVAPGTVSTALEQVRLATLAMQLPAFRQTVAMTQADLPVAGRVFNLDGLLGRDGIVGIKTGTTAHAGGCFLFAATARAGGRRVTIVGAVLHQMATAAQPSILAAAFAATHRVLAATRRALAERRVLRIGTALASVSVPWGGRVALRAARSVSVLGWPGLRVRVDVAAPAHPATPIAAGRRVGTAIVTAGSQRQTVPLVAGGALPGPSLGWRLRHP